MQTTAAAAAAVVAAGCAAQKILVGKRASQCRRIMHIEVVWSKLINVQWWQI
jgi:hypothetical protein